MPLWADCEIIMRTFFDGITKKEVDSLVKFHRDYGKEDKDDKRICDNCQNMYVHLSGVSERCCMIRREPFSNFTDGYAEPRMDGNAKSCKEFRRIV